MHDYKIKEFVLSNPSPTTVVMDQVVVTFHDCTVMIHSPQTFDIPAPSVPTWYYVTIDDSSFFATCETSDALVGLPGHTYIGAIQATPNGGSINALAGGWPAPQTFIVVGIE